MSWVLHMSFSHNMLGLFTPQSIMAIPLFNRWRILENESHDTLFLSLRPPSQMLKE